MFQLRFKPMRSSSDELESPSEEVSVSVSEAESVLLLVVSVSLGMPWLPRSGSGSLFALLLLIPVVFPRESVSPDSSAKGLVFSQPGSFPPGFFLTCSPSSITRFFVALLISVMVLASPTLFPGVVSLCGHCRYRLTACEPLWIDVPAFITVIVAVSTTFFAPVTVLTAGIRSLDGGAGFCASWSPRSLGF